MTQPTQAQHAIWFTEQAGAAEGAYHLALGIWFGPGLDEQALGEACAAVVERHPQLALAVAAGPAGPLLVPAAEKISLGTGLLGDDWTGHLRPYDLDRGPLARFVLLSAPDGRRLLLFTAHHLVFDGGSKEVLARDLATAYSAATTGAPVDLGAPAPVRAGVPSPSDVEAARAYWREHWSPPAGVLLPGLRRVPVAAEPGATVAVSVPSAIDPAARRLGVTRFELFLTAVHLVLARYGNAGLPVAVALSTRAPADRAEIGLHVNELPLRIAPAEGTVSGYAQALRSRLRALSAVRTVALTEAVGGLRPTSALTAVSVSYRRQRDEPVFAGVSTMVDWSMFPGSARNALNVFIVDAPDGPHVVLQHSPAAISVDAVERIGAHLSTIMSSIVESPDAPVATLALLPPAEEDLLRSWHGPDRRYPPHATVATLLADQVAARPAAPAIIDGDHRLTYADLDAATGRLAGQLADRGVGGGDLVAVSLPRSWRAVVALLAVVRAGAAYLPLDPSQPPARRDGILADAAPVLVLTTPALAADLPHGTNVCTFPDGPGPDRGPGPDLRAAADPGALAYVMYTSGSTGRPKGVRVPHGALANLLLAMRDLLGSSAADRWLALTSLSFDISGLELFLPLVTGGRVVVAGEGCATDGVAVTRLIRAHGVTHVQATPSGWRALLDGGFGAAGDASDSDASDSGASAVVALAGGEALAVPLARELRPVVSRLYNVYGPTETTIWSTADEVPAVIDEVTIGRPLANTRAHLLDDAGRPVPIGLPGELYLAGRGVADGYLRRPELTAARFPDHPSLGRLYRTGDLCRFRTDGRLVYIGRTDGQVKLRGHRIEPGEVEACLLSHPAVAEAVVAAHGAAPDLRLVAYLVARAGSTVDPNALAEHLGRTLPAVMVPSAWVVLDRLPHTPNGKLDRAALPDPPPYSPAGPAAGRSVDGADEVTADLLTIWRDVLQVPDLGVDDDLFDVGGHSLSITRIASRIHQRFGVRVPLDTFFDAPTVGEIAPLVRAGRTTAGADAAAVGVGVAAGVAAGPGPAGGGR